MLLWLFVLCLIDFKRQSCDHASYKRIFGLLYLLIKQKINQHIQIRNYYLDNSFKVIDHTLVRAECSDRAERNKVSLGLARFVNRIGRIKRSCQTISVNRDGI